MWWQYMNKNSNSKRRRLQKIEVEKFFIGWGKDRKVVQRVHTNKELNHLKSIGEIKFLKRHKMSTKPFSFAKITDWSIIPEEGRKISPRIIIRS